MSHKFQDSSDEEEEVKKGSAEDDQCPECDQVPTDDGCDCRSVSCCVCMCNMKHILDKDSSEYEGACFGERVDGYYCFDCNVESDDEEEHCSEYYSEEQEEDEEY